MDPYAQTNGVSGAHTPAPRKLGDLLAPALARVERRVRGEEKPIPLPWPMLAEHFGGGVWQGVHYLTKGTGIGGTQFCMQAGIHAARCNVPALYVGLEMGDFDVGVRALGTESGVPWSALWTGQAGEAYVARAREAIPQLAKLPFHVELAKPMGYSAGEVVDAFERVRALYPGDHPMFGVVDFVQLVGDTPGDEKDLRQRIATFAYALRELAVRLNVGVLAISSIAREKLKILPDIVSAAGLTWDDVDGCPVNRRMMDPDAIVGLGKESGEIEFSGDSVSVLARVAGTFDGHGCDVIFATAKGRATGPMWSPLRFTGFRYDECDDEGARVLEAWAAASEKRERAREERKEAKEQKKADKLDADAKLVAAYVLEHPGCKVREARAVTVADNGRRWAPAVARLGAAFVQSTGGCTVDASKLKPEHRSECAS